MWKKKKLWKARSESRHSLYNMPMCITKEQGIKNHQRHLLHDLEKRQD